MIPAFSLLLEDQIRSHATACKIPDAVIILGAIRHAHRNAAIPSIRHPLETSRAKSTFRICRAEPEVLVVTAGHLIVEIDESSESAIDDLSQAGLPAEGTAHVISVADLHPRRSMGQAG